MAFVNGSTGKVAVKAGQTLVFKPSQGFTAIGATAVKPKLSAGATYKPPSVPAGTRPTPPPPDPYAALDAATVDKRAGDLANAGLAPQQAELRRQQELARQGAVADEAAITGFSGAEANYLRGIPSQVGQGYRDAAATVGEVGTHVGGQVGADLAAAQAADQQFAESQGQSGGHTYDAGAAGDTVGYLGGVLPAEGLASQGAAAQAEAARAVQIPLDAGAQQLTMRMAQAKSENDQYAQQLISLAATYPGLKAQALQQLNQYELDKATYRENVANQKTDNRRQDAAAREGVRVDNANIAHAKRADAISARAEVAQEVSAGIKATQDTEALNYKWASLRFQNKKEADRAKAAAAKGKTIDVQSSKLLGHIVYKDGSEDASIKVHQDVATSAQDKAKVNRAKATSTARVTGFNYAIKLMGTPVVAKVTPYPVKDPKTGKSYTPKVGKYVADPKYASIKQGHPGAVYPPAYTGAPATTNNPGRAAHSGGGASDYADAQAKVWAEVDGDGLMARYGYSRQQVLAIVNAALARAGWRK